MEVAMSTGRNICEIRTAYQEITDYPLMDYERMRAALERLILENSADPRKGVLQILNQARKKIDWLDGELERVRIMKRFDEAYPNAELVCGVDEVGRGPLAGPVMTAAVILPKGFVVPLLNDSKQVSKKHREELYDVILNHAVAVGVGMNPPSVIDSKGIEFANKDAMRQAVRNLSVKPDLVLVDAVHIPDLGIPQDSMNKGDTKSAAIAAASIVAKVTRDRLMQEYDAMYPEYGFRDNVGYGSPAHIAALKQYGPCEIHRRGYIKNIV